MPLNVFWTGEKSGQYLLSEKSCIRMNRYVQASMLLSLVTHGTLIFIGSYRSSYDAYVHMFFADHYRRNWWSLWEPRWYTGFSVTSYPPLVHQVIGLMSHLLGVETAWAVILLAVLVLLPAGVYAFARIFVNQVPAGYAAILTPVLPSIYLTAHVFGQLPTLAGLLGVFFCLPALHTYLTTGKSIHMMLAVALSASVIASHHGTMLFLPWAGMAICLQLVLTGRLPIKQLVQRLLFFGAFALPSCILVIWPFWQWSLQQTMQVPIDHASRHNFLTDPIAAFMFFWPMYGFLPLFIPSLIAAMHQRKRLALGLLFLLMFILGLGGTTSLPRLLFGRGWEWLTYDRFALWASVSLLPFVGLLASVARHKLRKQDGLRKIMAVTFMGLLGIMVFLVVYIPRLYPLQPARLDMRPIVNFLNEKDHSRWRYLTFGFGDQMALLSRLTQATSPDGSSHTSRELPELRSSGLGQIDTAYWLPHGIKALDTIMNPISSYGVRWGFVNLSAYEKVLTSHGWRQIRTLENGVEVWENPSAILPRFDNTPASSPSFASISWGILPLLSLFLCGITFMRKLMISDL
jgi:hypothetical protein